MEDLSPLARSSIGKEPIDLLNARTQAWWASMIAGQMEQAHPVHGADLRVRFEGGVLTLRGSLPSQVDIDTLLREAERLSEQGITEVRSELSVTAPPDDAGLLVQTLLSAFESPAQARVAASFVTSHIHGDPDVQLVVEPGTSLEGVLPEGFAADAEAALAEGKTLLILTVDETAAFAARQVLEEETRSLWTQALPPQPASVSKGR